MKLHELSFGKIIILRDNIAEVIINEGVEINSEMVKEYHDFLLSQLTSPFSLLINKINSYTYDFDAQVNIATLNEIKSMAVVTYTRAKKVSTEALATINSKSDEWNLKMFSNREDALKWLMSDQIK